MSVARARMLEPLFKIDVPLTHSAVVIGGGIAGMTAANALGSAPFPEGETARKDAEQRDDLRQKCIRHDETPLIHVRGAAPVNVVK